MLGWGGGGGGAPPRLEEEDVGVQEGAATEEDDGVGEGAARVVAAAPHEQLGRGALASD